MSLLLVQDDDECGIGIKVKQSKGRYQVVEIAQGGPSSQTGQIFVGDSVLQIDGKHRESCAVRFAMLSTSACLSGLAGISVFGKKQQEVMDLLYGRADTILEVELERPSQVCVYVCVRVCACVTHG